MASSAEGTSGNTKQKKEQNRISNGESSKKTRGKDEKRDIDRSGRTWEKIKTVGNSFITLPGRADREGRGGKASIAQNSP